MLDRRGDQGGNSTGKLVDEAAKLTKPERVVYCDGSEAEYQRMIAQMLRVEIHTR